MSRITASSGYADTEFEDHEPYQGVLENYDIVDNKYNDKRRQLMVDWKVEGVPGHVRDWVDLTVNNRVDGSPSKLTQLLNAVSNKPPATKVEFDDETLEIFYDPATPYNKLSEGMTVVFRGQNGVGEDGNARYRIRSYQGPSLKQATRQKAQPVAVVKDVAPEEVPF